MIIHDTIMIMMINLAEVRHQRCHQLEAKPQTMIFHLLHMIAGHNDDDDVQIRLLEGNTNESTKVR